MTEASAPPGFLPGEIEDIEDDDDDTLEGELADTGANTQQAQQPSADWESDANPYRARQKEAQAWGTRLSQRNKELEEQVLRERNQRNQPQVDPNDPLAPQRMALEARERQLREEAEWSAIRSEHPPEVLTAYEQFARAWALDPSPRGAVNGFMQGMVAFAQAAAGGEQPPEQQSPLPSRAEASQPRFVDSSRSDAPNPDETMSRIARAKESKNLDEMVRAKLGFPPRRRN